MNSATEKTTHDKQTGTVASAPTKRPWHAPEIEEVDFAETQVGPSSGGDTSNYS